MIWTLDGAWSDAERARVDTLAAALPAEWAAVPLHLERVVSTDEHAPVGEHLAVAEPIEASIVHGLAHVLDRRHRWSLDRDFRALGGWRPWPWVGPSSDTDPLAFAAPRGRDSPAEDLATVAALLVTGDPERACDLPAKARHVAALLGRPPPTCPDLTAVGLDPGGVAEVDLVYVVATGHAASMAGHMLVVLRGLPDADGIAQEEAYGIVADTGGVADGSLEYAARGLSGGFVSRVVREPLDATLLRYTELEDRDVRFYRARLDPDAKRRLLGRLDELRQGWRRPYLFLTRNCVQLPLELATAAWPDLPELPAVVTPDVLLAALARRGHVEPVPPERLAERGIGTRAAAAERLRRAQEQRWTHTWPDLRPLLHTVRAPDPARRADAYGSLATLQGPRAADELRRWLSWSDLVEQARLTHLGRRGPGDPAVAAIRAALGALDRPTVATTGAAELHAALPAPTATGALHTPMRAWSVYGAADFDAEAPTGAIGLHTSFYDSRFGPGRRFVLSENMEITALDEDLRVGVGGLRSRTLAWRSVYAPGTRPVTGGFGLRAVDLELGGGRLAATWAEVDGVLVVRGGLLVAQLATGVAARTVDAALPALRPGIAVPVRGRIGVHAATSQRTGFEVDGALLPTLDTSGWLRFDWRAEATAGARLGAIDDADVGLELRGRAAPGREELGLGVWVERF